MRIALDQFCRHDRAITGYVLHELGVEYSVALAESVWKAARDATAAASAAG